MSNVNLLDAVYESVNEGLAKVGLPETPHNRAVVLAGMHKKITVEGVTSESDRLILQTIENEIIRLSEEE